MTVRVLFFKALNGFFENDVDQTVSRLLRQEAARKMTVKLIAAVNFINILGPHFLYESALLSFSLITFCQKSTFVQKMRE